MSLQVYDAYKITQHESIWFENKQRLGAWTVFFRVEVIDCLLDVVATRVPATV